MKKTYLTAFVVLLKTDKASHIYKNHGKYLFDAFPDPKVNAYNRFMYLVAPMDFTKGDHVVVRDLNNLIIGKVVADHGTTVELDLGWTTTQLKTKRDCEKIVATSNPELVSTPKISKGFQKLFTESKEEIEQVEVRVRGSKLVLSKDKTIIIKNNFIPRTFTTEEAKKLVFRALNKLESVSEATQRLCGIKEQAEADVLQSIEDFFDELD